MPALDIQRSAAVAESIGFDFERAASVGEIARLDLAYALRAALPRTARLDLSYELKEAIARTARLDLSWDLLAGTASVARFDLSWDLRAGVASIARLDLAYALQAALPRISRFDISYALNAGLPRIARLDLSYALNAEPSRKAFQWFAPYGDQINAAFEWFAPYIEEANKPFEWLAPLGEDVAKPFEWMTPLVEPVDVSFEWMTPLVATDSVTQYWQWIYSLVDEAATIVTGALSLTIDATGEEIAIENGSIEFREGGYAWIGTLSLADIRDYPKFNFDDPVTLTLYGEEYKMLVDSRSRRRTGPVPVDASINVISVSARYATPRAAPISVSFSAPMGARAMVESILGIPVDWQILDWIVPANRFGVVDASPMEAAQSIAEAAGGLIETRPDGTLYCRYLYPVSVVNYDTATPDHVFLESDSILEFDEQYRPQEIINALRIRDRSAEESAPSDLISFVADPDDSLAGLIYVEPKPFRPMAVETTSTGITLVSLGEQLVEATQQVEFRDGTATLTNRIFALTAITWHDTDLLGVTFDPFGTVLTSTHPTAKESLATVTYQRKVLVWSTSSTVADTVQYLACEVA